MQFQKIAVVDKLLSVGDTQAKLEALSLAPVEMPDADPIDDAELKARAKGADALIVTWRTQLAEWFFVANPQLKFIAMAASPFVDRSSSSIDLDAAAKHGVTVSALGQYGDEATAEWIMATLLNAAHHVDGPHWRNRRAELFEKKLGIIGLSHMGIQVARRAAAFGMEVVYWSRSPKPFAEELGYKRLELDELLATSDIVSVHIAKNVTILDAVNMAHLRPSTLLINTSIGVVIEPAALKKWIDDGGVCIADATTSPELAQVMHGPGRSWVSPMPAGDTQEMFQRRSDQLVEALGAFLNDAPVRVVQ